MKTGHCGALGGNLIIDGGEKGHLMARADKRNLQIGKGGIVKWIGESRTVWQK